MNKFQEKKKLLAAESEVYRELLKLEFQTFKIYGKRTKRKLTSAGAFMPLVMSGIPIISSLFGRKRGGALTRIGSLVMLGWKTYQRFAPMFGGKKSVARLDGNETAAEEYLFPKTVELLDSLNDAQAKKQLSFRGLKGWVL